MLGSHAWCARRTLRCFVATPGACAWRALSRCSFFTVRSLIPVFAHGCRVFRGWSSRSSPSHWLRWRIARPKKAIRRSQLACPTVVCACPGRRQGAAYRRNGERAAREPACELSTPTWGAFVRWVQAARMLLVFGVRVRCRSASTLDGYTCATCAVLCAAAVLTHKRGVMPAAFSCSTSALVR